MASGTSAETVFLTSPGTVSADVIIPLTILAN